MKKDNFEFAFTKASEGMDYNDEREWILWQYSNRGRVEGISGLVDVNVFNGSLAEFQEKLLK